MLRTALVFLMLLVALPSYAGTIAVVDFQRAVQQTEQGKSAQAKIDSMYQARKAEIQKAQTALEKEITDFQARAMILSEQARGEQEQALMQKQAQFQQMAMQYEQELQQTYQTVLQDLDTKMRALSATIAKEKGYSLVIDNAVVVHMGGDVVDMTGDLVARYNQAHK